MVKIDDIRSARETLKGVANLTPLLADDKMSKELDATVTLKAESLQKGGSFKLRGAFNKISQLSDDEKERGVVTASAGNHAQGVALAATLNGIKSTVVLPDFAPLTKIVATKNFGAEVIMHGNSFDEAVDYSRGLAAEKGFTYVHAFDDEKIIAGQGTIGLEIADSLPDVDVVVVPIGGGGIISGIALALKDFNPKVRIVGVQAENISPMKTSFDADKHTELETYTPTIADGIAIKRPGAVTFPIIREYVDDIVTVSEEEIARGIFHCVQNSHLVVEGAGAAGVAALLAKKVKINPGENVCAVLCGGNIDGNLLSRVLEQVLVRQGRYAIFKLLVLDRPGNLAEMLNHVAETGANVVEVFHQRAIWLAPLGRVGIEVILEVRDEQHTRDVMQHMEKYGYHIERQGQGDWEE